MGIGKVTLGNFGANIFRAKNDTQNLENTKQSNETSKATNPFGVSFKGNVIHADVFESTKIENTEVAENKVVNRGKLFISAVVGNINNFNDSIKSRMNSVVSFGRQIKERTSQAIQKIANTQIDFKAMGESIRNTFMNPYSVDNLSKRPVGELEELLKAELA